MAGPRSHQDAQVEEADRRNGEPGATDDVDSQGEHEDALLDQHPDPGQMPSDVEVQAERQEPLS
jgi:hypothetical protein